MKIPNEEVLNHIKNLSFPRRTGSPGEEKAVRYILDFFKKHSIATEIQEFHFSMCAVPFASRIGLLIIPMLMIFSAPLVEQNPLLSIVLLILALAIFPIATRWSWLAEKIAASGGKDTARNIIARIPASHPQREIVFLAHHDSKSQVIPIFIRAASLIVFLFLFFISFILVSLNAAGFLMTSRDFMLYFDLIALLFTLPFFLNINRNASPGAIDNASGISVMMELARILKGTESSNRTSFTFIATGAEEEGLIGAVNFIRRYAGMLGREKTLFINFDSVGAPGKIILIDRIGTWGKKRSQELSARLMNSARAHGIDLVRGGLPPGTGVDSFPICYRGYEAVTLSSRKLSSAILSIHSSRDTFDHIDPGSIGQIAELALTFSSSEQVEGR